VGKVNEIARKGEKRSKECVSRRSFYPIEKETKEKINHGTKINPSLELQRSKPPHEPFSKPLNEHLPRSTHSQNHF